TDARGKVVLTQRSTDEESSGVRSEGGKKGQKYPISAVI
ncbi:unnamed protein product, partial [marine sediment metagenome]